MEQKDSAVITANLTPCNDDGGIETKLIVFTPLQSAGTKYLHIHGSHSQEIILYNFFSSFLI